VDGEWEKNHDGWQLVYDCGYLDGLYFFLHPAPQQNIEPTALVALDMALA